MDVMLFPGGCLLGMKRFVVWYLVVMDDCMMNDDFNVGYRG